MKMTIITDAHGNILGAAQGHTLSAKEGDVEVSVSFAPGHQTHLLEVDDDMGVIEDIDVYQQRLKGYLHKHQQSSHPKP